MNPFTRLGHLFLQVLFGTITPLLLVPAIGRLRVTRRAVSFFFGKLYGNRYEKIIDSFEGRYELAMTEGLASAKRMTGGRASVILDCGTGTGFVTRQAAKEFPAATFIGLDIHPGMLRQARDKCKHLTNEVLHVRADAFALPLADQSVGLVLAQNTMPCIAEFARVCRPGGVTVYVDSSAGWIAGLVKRLVEKHGLFEQVIGKRVGWGVCVLAQKPCGDEGPGKAVVIEGAKQQGLGGVLRCPVDRSKIVMEENRVCCENGHHYPIRDGFPMMLETDACAISGRPPRGCGHS